MLIAIPSAISAYVVTLQHPRIVDAALTAAPTQKRNDLKTEVSGNQRQYSVLSGTEA